MIRGRGVEDDLTGGGKPPHLRKKKDKIMEKIFKNIVEGLFHILFGGFLTYVLTVYFFIGG